MSRLPDLQEHVDAGAVSAVVHSVIGSLLAWIWSSEKPERAAEA
jgi:hypothetical protein